MLQTRYVDIYTKALPIFLLFSDVVSLHKQPHTLASPRPVRTAGRVYSIQGAWYLIKYLVDASRTRAAFFCELSIGKRCSLHRRFFFFFCIFCNTFLAHLLQYIRTAVVAPFKHVAFIPAGGRCFCTVLGYLLRSFVSYNMLILFFTPACNCPTLIPSRFAPRGCRQLLSYFQATSKG